MDIRKLYLYLFSLIGLLIVVIGAVQMVDLALNVFVFPDADRYGDYPRFPGELGSDMSDEEQIAYEAQMVEYQEIEQSRSRQRQLSSALAMLVVGLPLYLYHWRTITREKEAAHG